MRIFFVSDAPWHTTGYGVTTKHLTRRMVEDGHEVFCYAPGAAHHGVIELAPNLTVLTADFGDDRWGNHTINHLIQTFNPDLIVTWLDAQGLDSYAWTEVPVFMWAPIDTWPVPSHEMGILGRAKRVMAPSVWGVDVLAEQEMKADYIPCGIDLDTYTISPEGRQRWRAQMRPELSDDTFLIGMVGLNTGSPDRKGYGFAFDVIKQFSGRHNDVRVYMHTNASGGGGAIDLYDLRREMGLEDVIAFSRPTQSVGETPLFMRDMYNAFDVLLHAGMCEGFGIPLVEAQACGTPVVFNSCTSMTELVQDGYPSEPLADMIVSTCTRIALPSVPNMLAQLEYAYADWKARRHHDIYRERIRSTVLRFDQDAIYDHKWRPLLAEVPERFNFENAGPRKLMLAAGGLKKEGFTHHDKEILFGHHDVAHDLNEFPWPWEDNAWDYIEFSDCLEHLRANFIEVMDELWRITAPGGHVYIHTAEAGSWQLQLDPTHVQGFRMESMDYLDPEKRHGMIYSYSNRKWKIEVKTRDPGGLLFILQPRKTADVRTLAEVAS